MSAKITPEEIKLRGSLLAKNKDLLKLHKDLVFSNILSEEEFWEDRKGLLRIQEMILKQKKGASSALVSDDLKPSTASTSDVKYVLTPTIIQTIFEQHPILQKAFSDLVGSVTGEEGVAKLTEREFWIEYFKSPFFTEPKTTNAVPSNLLDSYYKETISESDGPHSLEETNVKVSGQCDMSRTQEDHVNDYVLQQAETHNDSSWNALRQFNKHSLRVLQAQTSLDSPHELSIEISDLNVQLAPEMALLNVKESQMFTQHSGSKSETTRITERITKDAIEQVLKGQDDKTFDAAKFQLNYTKSKEMLSSLLERNNFHLNLDPKQSSPISPDLSDDQLQLLNSAIEILRHFWRTATSGAATKITPEKLAKLTRLVSVLEKMESRIRFSGKKNLVECIKQAKLKYNELNK